MTDTKSPSNAASGPHATSYQNLKTTNGGARGPARKSANSGARAKAKGTPRPSTAAKKLRTHAPTRSKKADAKPQTASSATSAAFPWLLEDWQSNFNNHIDLWRQSMDNLPNSVKTNLDQSRTALSDASDTVKKSSLHMAEGLHTINRRVINNFRDDLSRWMSLPRDLMEARDFGEATQIQANFMRQCVKSYLQHSKELSELSMETARTTWTPFSGGFTAYYEKARGITRPRSK